MTGSGFPLSIEKSSEISVNIGGSPASLLLITNSFLIIRTPARNSSAISTCQLIISFNGQTTNPATYTYDDNLTPTILSITPSSSSPSQKQTIKVTGTIFGTDQNKIQVYLFNSSNSSIFYQLSIVNVSNTELYAVLGGGKIGTYTLMLHIPNSGYSIESTTDSAKFNYDLSITGVSPTSGSLYGGTILTFIGKNFSPINSQNQIYIGDTINNLCDIISSNATILTCRTRVAPLTAVGSPQVLYMTQRVQDEAICMVSGGCSFTFSSSKSPIITTNSLIAKAGDTVVLMGSGLTPDSNEVASITFYNGTSRNEIFAINLSLQVDTVSSSQITFRMPALREGSYNIQVLVGNKGWAQLPDNFTLTTPLVAYGVLLSNPALNSTRTGSKGGLMMTVVGNGFYNESIYLDKTKTFGVIYSRNNTAITFSTGQVPSATTYNFSIYRSNTEKTTCGNCSFITTLANTASLNWHDKSSTVESSFILSGYGSNLDFGTNVANLILLDNLNRNLQKTYSGTVTFSNNTNITVSFSDIPMGVYLLTFLYEEKGFAFFSSESYRTIVVQASALAPVNSKVISSVIGGKFLNFTGLGLPLDWTNTSLFNITVCASICPVISNNLKEVACELPDLLTSEIISAFSLFNQSNIEQKGYQVYSDNIASQMNINDLKLNSFYDSGNLECFLIFDFGDKFALNVTSINYYPTLTKSLKNFYGLNFQVNFFEKNITPISFI